MRFVSCFFMGLVIFVTIGCGGSEVTKRLKMSQEDIKHQVDGTNSQSSSLTTDSNRAILRCLENANESTLAIPELCFAMLQNVQGEKQLIVYWLESQPSPNAVRLTSGDGAIQTDLKFEQMYLDENRKDAIAGVVFAAVIRFDDHDIAKQLEGISKLSVTLLKDGEAASNTLVVRTEKEAAAPGGTIE